MVWWIWLILAGVVLVTIIVLTWWLMRGNGEAPPKPVDSFDAGRTAIDAVSTAADEREKERDAATEERRKDFAQKEKDVARQRKKLEKDDLDDVAGWIDDV